MSDPISTNAASLVSQSSLPDGFKFWMTWGVSLLSGVATTAAVFVVLFKRPPKLQLHLRDPKGEKTPVAMMKGGASGRFFHLKVSNDRRKSIARNAQVVLLKVEEPAIGNGWKKEWESELPIAWQHGAVTPQTRTIGPPSNADLFCVTANGDFFIYPIAQPLNLPTHRTAPIKLIFSFQVKADEGASGITRILIDWDGKWHEDENELFGHLKVEELI